MGKGAPLGPAAAIIIGAVVCCAAAIAGDNLQDLKTGYIVGATPWKQQVMLAIGTLSGAAVIAPVLTLLQHAYGFAGQATAGPRALPAPQANVMASVAKGIFSDEGLDWTFILVGMAVAITLIVTDTTLERRHSTFRTPVLAVAIGFYLPFSQSAAIFIGGVIATLVKRTLARMRASQEVQEVSEQRSVLFASGLITGEALMGILVAIPTVLMKNNNLEMPLTALWQQKAPDVLEPIRTLIDVGGAWVGFGILLLIGLWAYVTGRFAKK
jgi:putative OPT family oligopeptide transporter